MLSRIRAQLPLWRRALRRRRRTLTVLTCALLLAVLVPSVLPAVLPASSRPALVVVSSADLPAGAELEASHLRTVRVARELAPPGAADSPDRLQGRRTTVPVPAGTPLLPGMIGDDGPAAVPEGSVLMSISADRMLAPHLSPGAAVEILSATPEPGSARSTRARVVEVAAAQDSASPGIGAAPSGQVVVLITVDQAGARDLAHALHEGWMTVTLVD